MLPFTVKSANAFGAGLFTDDQAYDTIGVYSNPNVKTPNMDFLATGGVVFDRFYVTTATILRVQRSAQQKRHGREMTVL